MSVNIHGKQYITVTERLQMAKDHIQEIYTEVLTYEPNIIVRATVMLKDGRKATGISGANPSKMIEKSAPVEVAETSALGRALGFLNFGLVDGVATADEIAKVDATEEWMNEEQKKQSEEGLAKALGNCKDCGQPNMIYKKSGKVGCSAYCWRK